MPSYYFNEICCQDKGNQSWPTPIVSNLILKLITFFCVGSHSDSAYPSHDYTTSSNTLYSWYKITDAPDAPPTASHPEPTSPPPPEAKAAHSRSFSYQQMQQMGLSKAIDEYHRLLETGDQINTPRIKGKGRSSGTFISSILKSTVIRPLPTIVRPETIIAFVGTLWSIISFLIYYTAPIIVPLVVWLALAPSAPLQLPAQITKAYPALKNTQLAPPSDYKTRAAIVCIALVVLRAAEAAVAARALRRRETAESTITPERLEAYYAGSSMAGAGNNNAMDIVSSQDWQLVVKEVYNLSKQYEDAPLPVRTRDDALAWLDRVATVVGLTISREAHHGVDAALKAVDQVRRMLVE